ncbi:MAG: hypothetical protein M3347_19035 [Armatimonadota bacterium]|nr:hypothetical protein [Armatimonadota bacterium]
MICHETSFQEGDGYDVEARVPWALLNAEKSPPKSGDTITLVAQPLWGDAEVLKHAVSFTDIVNGPGFPFQNAAVWGRGELLAKGNLAPSQRPLSSEHISEPLQLSLPLPDAQATNAHRGRVNLSSDTARHRVLWLDWTTRQLLAQFGETDRASDDATHLSAPGEVAVQGTRAGVADSGNQRVMKLELKLDLGAAQG